jgi:hypothetical protein
MQGSPLHPSLHSHPPNFEMIDVLASVNQTSTALRAANTMISKCHTRADCVDTSMVGGSRSVSPLHSGMRGASICTNHTCRLRWQGQQHVAACEQAANSYGYTVLTQVL